MARFLRQIVGIRADAPLEAVQFALQRVNIGYPSIQERVALCIAPEKELLRAPNREPNHHRMGRPDAWIWCDGAFAALIETKIRGRVSLEAFSPHRSFTSGLVHKLRRSPQEFVNALRPLKRDKSYHIRLRESFYRNPSSPYKGRAIDRSVDYLEIHPSVVRPGNLHQLIIEPIEARLRRSELRPEIFVVRNFRLSELVGKNDVVDLIASAAEDMYPYLDYASEL